MFRYSTFMKYITHRSGDLSTLKCSAVLAVGGDNGEFGSLRPHVFHACVHTDVFASVHECIGVLFSCPGKWLVLLCPYYQPFSHPHPLGQESEEPLFTYGPTQMSWEEPMLIPDPPPSLQRVCLC